MNLGPVAPYSAALHFVHYNLAKAHMTLKTTPAKAIGLSDHVWIYEEIAAPA